jgi:hypothetical protein
VTKICTADIPFGTVYAYRRGDTITDAALDEHPEWNEFVTGRDTQAARELLAEITGEPSEPAAPRKTTAKRAVNKTTSAPADGPQSNESDAPAGSPTEPGEGN